MKYCSSCVHYLFSGFINDSHLRAVSLRKAVRRTASSAFLATMALLAPAAWAVSPTVTTLTISSTSVPYKIPITLTATVTSSGVPVTAGLVLFCDATAPVCENNSALGLAQLSFPGAAATLRLGSGTIGVHSYKAVYRPNSSYVASTSNTVSYTVNGTYPSTTTIASIG
jgi:hypothetical protein